MGFFYNAFKSFLFLEKFAPTPENYNGKLASTIGNLIIFIKKVYSINLLQEKSVAKGYKKLSTI